MGKAKGKWLLALLALAFAAILAAVLCMNFPMAEVHAETAVAKVTAATGETQTYEKLSDAFKAAKDGDTVTLLRNAEITERIVIENKSVVFDLGEYTLTMDEDFSTDDSVALRAGTNGILTIEAGTNGTIDAQNAHDYLVPVAAMASGSRVIINGGTIIVNTAYESCVYAGGGGTVVIEDGVFKNLCQEPFAYVQDGSSPALAVNISDSYTDGGAYLTINGGTFVGRNPMLGDTNPGVTSSYMDSDVNIAQLSDGSFAAVGADDPLPEGTEYFYTEKDGEIVVTVYTPEALAAAVAGDETFADNTFTVVRLGAAIEQGITIADGRVLTLDLNGFKLTNSGDSHTIYNNGTLTIIDGGENGEVTNTSAGKAVILNNGEMTLAGGKYTRTADHYVIDNNKGNMTIEAGVTVESPSTLSSMIRNGGDNNAVGATPTLTINGGSFSGGLNTIKNDDYGILHINGGSFSNTTQHVILNWSTATIEGGTFTPQNDAYAAVWTGTWYTSANFTQGVTVIEDGIFNGAVTTGIGEGAPQTTAKADYTISGGTFNAEVNSSADDIGYITGGEFAELPDASAFAPGYVAADPDGDGIYTTVDEAQGDYAVSMTFDNKRAVYESLADALAAAPTDGTEATITLLDNITLTGSAADTSIIPAYFVIGEAQTITLDLNGYSISYDSRNIDGNNSGALFVNSGNFTVVGTGTITNINDNAPDTAGAIFYNVGNGELTIAGGTYDALVNLIQVGGIVTVQGNVVFKSEIGGAWGDANKGVGAILNGGTFRVEEANGATPTFDNVIVAFGSMDVQIDAGTFNGSKGASDFTGSDETLAIAFGYGGNNTLTITGDSVFNAGIGKTSSTDSVAITGGTFTEPVPAAYLEDGYSLTVTDGVYGITNETAQASVTRGETEYRFVSFAEALAIAENGDTVTLLASVTENVVIEKSITLDLNGKTISSASGYAVNVKGAESEEDKITVSILSTGDRGTIGCADNSVALNATGFAEISVENVAMSANVYGIQIGNNTSPYQTVVRIEDSTVYGATFAGVYIMGTDAEDKPVTFTAENSDISGYYYGISGNGTYHNTYIELNNTKVQGLAGTPESTDYENLGYGIYHPQRGTLIVNGGEITGVAGGIEIRSGSLTVRGDAVISATAENFYISPNSSGTTTVGAAIAVSQHSTNNTIEVVLEDGTYNGIYSLYEMDVQDPSEGVSATLKIEGGTYNGEVESTNVTGFISGGMFKYRPAEDYMNPDFVAELQNGYYVPVESSALRAAQANAQADVREYVLMLGMKWTEVQALADKGDENAVALVAAYNAIADTTSEKGVAEARLKAMDAADAFAAAQEDAWEQAKADKIAELESWRDENANGLVIPLYIYTAMNSAADEEELNSYFEQAKAEIGDIYAYRNQITAQSEDLQTLKDTLTALNGALTGENNSFDELLSRVEEAIGKAQSAIIGTDADSDSLAGIRDYLENTINAALEGIDDAVSGTNGIASELAGISDVLNGFTSKLDTITDALDEETGWIAEAIEKAQGDITSILTALDSLADSTDIEALADSLAQILEDIAAVQGTVDEIEGEVSAVSSVQEAKDEALTDIGEWLNNYLDSIIGGTDEANGGALVALAFTAETTDGDIYAKLTKVFSEDNAQLVLRYYNEALASIDAATTVSEVTTAVSTFKAQVASVEAAAQNTTNLTGLYVLLVIVLVAVVVVLVIVIVKKNRSAEAAEQPAEEAEQPVPAEEVPAAEPEQPEPAAEENELAAEADDDKEQVVIAANVRSFSEAYVELNEELLDLFNKVKEYALAKDGAAEVKQSNGICIKRNGKQIVKLTVRRGYPVALFFLENEMLKDFRRTTNTNAKLKIRATELVLREAADLEAAYTMVDLSVEQIDKDIENAKERRREACRARRKQKQLEEEAQQQEIAAGSAENGENERP